MTTTFFLIRHAAHDMFDDRLVGRSEGVCLSEAGMGQAILLAERMRRERFDSVVSSPRERTCETASVIAAACGIGGVEIDPDLDEVDFGEWSGKTFEELSLDPRWQHWNDERGLASTPAGETMQNVQHRVVCCMDRLAKTNRNRALVLVSHAEVIKAAVCHYLGLPLDNWFRFDVAPASITTVVTGGWGGKLIGLNEPVA
ncbi:histidine phosphatase family protein [Pseudaminobacter sp. NGMCC 1.201702]|uniref:histidine phosphatase family protein n=1 Tax=Pseudaminobacter sp. NGMCC 1.201702 TaxID=3391825 RepID=UPI0039F036E0